MFNLQDALYVASLLNVKFDKFTPQELILNQSELFEHFYGLLQNKHSLTEEEFQRLINLMKYHNYADSTVIWRRELFTAFTDEKLLMIEQHGDDFKTSKVDIEGLRKFIIQKRLKKKVVINLCQEY